MFSSKALPPTFASGLEFITKPQLLVTWLSFVLISYWYFDEAIAFYIHNNLPRSASLYFKQISKLGIAGYYLVTFVTAYFICRYMLASERWTRCFIYLSSSLIFPGLFCDLIKFTIGRYRPRMLFSEGLYGLHFFTIESKMWSFPSGHSVTIMGLMVALSLLFPRRWLWFWLFGVAISLTRVMVTAHYLSDVMVGMLIGAYGAIVCYLWVQRSTVVKRYLLPRLDEVNVVNSI